MTNAADYQHCPDFSTAINTPGKITAAAWAFADDWGRDRSEAEKRQAAQGFIHSFQNRADLLATASDAYRTGHSAALFATFR